jgi:hypothetical protein
MIIIKNNEINLLTMIDVINYRHLVEDLKEAIVEYIISNQQRAILNGAQQNVFHVSGLSQYHHDRLGEYLNRHLLKGNNLQASPTAGQFAQYPVRHNWLQLDDMIIDIAVSQFAEKEINLLPRNNELTKQHCFICDNPQNFFYNLYATE